MKTRTRAAKHVMTQYNHGFRIGFILIALIGLAMVSCSDDEKATGPDTREQFVGNYQVEDISNKGYTYKYTVSITKGAKGDLEISNFADIMHVPVKAKAIGNKLIIESQTFKDKDEFLVVDGSGTFANDVLTFNYKTTGQLNYQGTCTAKKY